MNRLICAEWYKMRHAHGLIKYFIIGCLLCPAVVILGSQDVGVSFSKLSFAEGWKLIGENGLTLIIMFIPVIISVYIGRAFNNKTMYYEIMEGHKPSDIIFSKIVVITLTMGIGLATGYVLLLGSIASRNGYGHPIPYFGERILLLITIIIHISVVSVLVNMIFRNGILAGLVSYLRFCLIDMLSGALIQGQTSTSGFLRLLNHCTLYGQWGEIVLGKMSIGLIIGIIGTTIFEGIILYIIAIVCMKKVEYR